MNDSITPYFTQPDVEKAMRRGILIIPNIEPTDELTSKLKLFTEHIIGTVLQNPSDFNEHCQYNIARFGSTFVEILSNIQTKSNETENNLKRIFAICYRFLCEYEFTKDIDLPTQLNLIKEYIEQNTTLLDDFIRGQVTYATYAMPAAITKKILHSNGISDAIEFNRKILEASKLKNEWDADLKQKIAELQNLKEISEKIESKFNFVALTHGFQEIKKEKITERRVAFFSLLALGALILAPLLAEGHFVYRNIQELKENHMVLLYTIPTIAAIEIILLYFFRIVLNHFNSVKAQILQLSLRTTLCQFIQSYSDYSQKIKKSDASALEKFENVIFSGIISNEDKIPPTFDGLDQIAKLIKSVKN